VRRAAIVGLAIVLGVAGCTGDPASPAPMPSTAMPSAPVASAAEPPAAVVETRAVDAAGDRLTMTMTPLVRRGGAVVMTVHTRLDATRGRGSSVVTRHFSTILATSFDDVRLVDETGRRVYPVATGPGGRCVCTGSQRLSVGDEAPLQAVFTGVPAEVTRLSVMLPYAGVFAGVPVTAGDVPPAAEPLDPASAGASAAADLDAHTERLDVPLRTRRTPDRVDLSIDADVLFRLDSAELTSGAGRTVDAAVRDLRAAGPGPLTVTGHTDDSGTAAHNQALSEGRARTVAAALAEALPAGQWPVTVAGRGEAEPAVPNTSAANRRLNRRVTVSYRAARTPTPAAQTTAPQTPAARAALPPAEGVVGTAADGVEIALPLGRGTVRFVPGAARLRGPFLQVDLVARNVGDDPATILDLLGQGVFTARDEFDPYAPYGASGVRLLDGVTTAHGLDYVTADGGHRCLCDRLLNVAIPPGSERVIALWFPAPAPGTTTVALDVPGRFRLTGVPVT
jgi:outer membrane protein OmpA-like peptidoglycan-associated protein